ncbi:MAG: phosphoenolpyruvate--protein phosphotransferase [Thalassobaculales bacterium]
MLQGVGAAPGIAVGPAFVLAADTLAVPRFAVEDPAAEMARFAAAVAKARRQIRKLKAKTQTLHGAAGEELELLLDAHEAMLTRSRLLRGVEARIREGPVNAEAAVEDEVEALFQQLAGVDAALAAARLGEVREVANRLIRLLSGTPFRTLADAPAGAVLVAESLTPAETALLDPRRIAGFCTVQGGPQGHTAIMARSLGLPAVLGITDLMERLQPGDRLALDGSSGQVIVRPDPATTAVFQRRRAAQRREAGRLRRLVGLPAVTRDGVAVRLEANLELPREMPAADAAGAEGIGLLRTEFLFMNRPDLPSEDEQYLTLKTIVQGMAGRPVTIRTLDLGGDKLAAAVAARGTAGANPALGLRAIRLCLAMPELMDPQLRAILRAAAHGPVRILLPLVTSVAEVLAVRERLGGLAGELGLPMPPVGVMIEVPGAALSADALAQAADFFAIDTNDLTQYTLAIDRGDEQVAALYDPFHPAVLRLVQFSVEAALRRGIPVSVCGEVAGDPRFTPLLVGLGVRELSMAARSLPLIRQRVRGLSMAACLSRARNIMEQWDAARIRDLMDAQA